MQEQDTANNKRAMNDVTFNLSEYGENVDKVTPLLKANGIQPRKESVSVGCAAKRRDRSHTHHVPGTYDLGKDSTVQ